MVVSDDVPERRSRLLSAKLRAMARSVVGDAIDAFVVEPFPLGTALVGADSAWFLIETGSTSALGSCLGWAMRRGLEVNIVTDQGGGALARRATGFTWPVTVWDCDGPAITVASPVDHRSPQEADQSRRQFIELITDCGAEPVLEFGVLTGEVRGLEVCRVVTDPDGTRERLEVGMGVHDREVFSMVHAETPIRESLADVVATVRGHRVPGAAHHPFNSLAIERFMRWRVMDDPGSMGLEGFESLEPPTPRANVADAVPCVGRGRTRSGRHDLMVFVNGIDLDVVPFAVDAAKKYRSDAVSIVSRSKDVTPTMRSMASRAVPHVGFIEFLDVAPRGL